MGQRDQEKNVLYLPLQAIAQWACRQLIKVLSRYNSLALLPRLDTQAKLIEGVQRTNVIAADFRDKKCHQMHLCRKGIVGRLYCVNRSSISQLARVYYIALGFFAFSTNKIDCEPSIPRAGDAQP